MKVWEIFRFELVYQFCRLWTWLFAIVLILITFLMTRDKAAVEAIPDDFIINSPFLIASTTVFGGLMWMMMAAVIAGDIGARDITSRSQSLFYTTSISEAQYLTGRFSAAVFINSLLLLCPQIGIILGTYLPGVPPEVVGPFRLNSHLAAYAYVSLPIGFVATAIQYAFALATGRAMAAYFGSFLLFFMGFFVASFLFFGNEIGVLLDPIGIRFIVEDMARMWTTIEKKTRPIDLTGHVLINRLIWTGVGVFTLLMLYWKFKFRHRVALALNVRYPIFKFTRKRFDTEVQVPPRHPELPETAFGFRTQIRQTFEIGVQSFLALAKSIPGLFLLCGIPLMTIPVVIDQMESIGSQVVPTTARVISELTAPISSELSRWVIIPALIIYFAGELIWREREARINEISDTMPGSEWAPFAGKFAGLTLVLFLFTLLQMLAGIVAQTIMNYSDHELHLFFKVLFGLQLPEYLLFTAAALFIHVMIRHKYFAHLTATMMYVFIALPTLFSVEHSLLVFGAGPTWSYSEMRGFDPTIGPWLWFKLYWAAWALLLAIIARLFWTRGSEEKLAIRIRTARARFISTSRIVGLITVMLVISLGGFIFYNTNILNEYVSSGERKERAAEYERRYARFSSVAAPDMSEAKLNIDIFPETRRAEIRGRYTLINRTQTMIDSIHLAVVPGLSTETTFNVGATLVTDDLEVGHRTYRLNQSLRPGDAIELLFRVDVVQNGFRVNGRNASIAKNGTYFTNKELFPGIGYQQERELVTASDRLEYGLEARPLIAFLTDENAYHERGRGVSLDIVISTSAAQVAVAPGMLRNTWIDSTSSARRYFHYSTLSKDGASYPLGNEWSFFSANYAMKEMNWNASDSGHTVTIQLFHDPRHTRHLDRTAESVIASLDYHSKHFGPYRYRYLTVVERPGLGSGAHADAAMISHGEGYTHWIPRNSSSSHDHAFAIMAHEMAHQWTIAYAPVEGAPVMSESIAWYYAMKAIEASKGKAALRNLFNFMWQPHPYAPIRRGEPLLRGVDPYMSYRKGPFALYTLSEYLGDARVNRALRNLRESHRSIDTPLATTLDLYKHLDNETPDSLKSLLTDLFLKNTYWKLKAENATAERKGDSWILTLNIKSEKQEIDSAGVKHEHPMNEWIDIGVYGEPDETGKSETLYLQKHRIISGVQVITIPLRMTPHRAGIDPNHVLDWEERSEANMTEVRLE